MAAARRQQALLVDPRQFPQVQRAEQYRITLRGQIDAMFTSYSSLINAAKTQENSTKLHSSIYAEQEALNLELQTETLIQSANELLTTVQQLEQDRLLYDLEATRAAREQEKDAFERKRAQLSAEQQAELQQVANTVNDVAEHLNNTKGVA
eukprot:TRINITY_DN10048_c0_g1_i1.p1 TRINITY_DN10048_c0_g1~~TRINITY_DN10048_c0_g1_i1.p1  ORF type:complete len:151 (+),score=46.81 TRINITY_DN10048_c0_g1_i1:94-546(+)